MRVRTWQDDCVVAGYSYGQILQVVTVAKGTLNVWLKDIELTRVQKERILARMKAALDRARQKGAWQNRNKSRERIRRIVKEARKELSHRIHDLLFFTGVVLQGGKSKEIAALHLREF